MNSHWCLRFARGAMLFAGALSLMAATRDLDDRPLRVIQPYATDFPVELSTQGITTGQVRAVLNVDADGRLTDCLVASYTHPELARDLLANLRDWSFEPARKRGEPVGVRTEINFSYEARGIVLSVSASEMVTSAMRGWVQPNVTTLVCLPRELDRPVTAVQAVPPVHPGPGLQPARSTGTATLDFFIDAEGRPRMPVVLSSSHDAFAFAAVDALEKWRFAPPTRDGKPVAVRVRQQFVFSPRK